MKIAAFNFSKMSVERMKDSVENLKIVTDIGIQDLKEIKTEFLQPKEAMIQVNFSYLVKYDPGVALVELGGNILIILDEKQAKEVLKDWKKKQISETIKTFIFNVILRKATLKSLHLEEEVNLPLHVSLPTIRSSEKDSKEK